MITKFNTSSAPISANAGGAPAKGMSAETILGIVSVILLGYFIYRELNKEPEKAQENELGSQNEPQSVEIK